MFIVLEVHPLIVLAAFYKILPRKPDLVLSRNKGANIGQDVLYSGTVAAALEACFGYESYAFSTCHTNGKANWESVMSVVGDFLEKSFSLSKNTLNERILNVNIPNLSYGEIKGFFLPVYLRDHT